MVSRQSSIAPTGSCHEADRGDANTSGLNQATSILAFASKIFQKCGRPGPSLEDS